MYTFKKFTGKDKRLESRITVTSTFRFGLPTKFYEDEEIAKYNSVVIHYDKSRNAIGLKFTNESGKDCFKIMHSKQGYGGHILAKSFFKAQDMDPKKFKGRYEWKVITDDEFGKLYVFELKERQDQSG